jgi:hypothetical protein
MRSHAETIVIETEKPINPTEARDFLKKAPGVCVCIHTQTPDAFFRHAHTECACALVCLKKAPRVCVCVCMCVCVHVCVCMCVSRVDVNAINPPSHMRVSCLPLVSSNLPSHEQHAPIYSERPHTQTHTHRYKRTHTHTQARAHAYTHQ